MGQAKGGHDGRIDGRGAAHPDVMASVAGVDLVVTDLDGTLWDNTGTVHPSTHAALEELDRRDIPLLVATGRRRRSLRIGFERAGLVGRPAVLLDGALGCHAVGDDSWLHCPLTPGAVTLILEAFGAAGYEPLFEADHDLHDVVVGSRPPLPENLLAPLETLVVDLREPLPVAVFGVTAILERPAVFAVAEPVNDSRQATAMVTLYNDFPDTGVIRVRPGTCSKWEGVESWLAYSDMVGARVLAVGNDSNDLEMLEGADVAVAVKGGYPDAVRLGHHLIPSADEGGWAQILDLL